MLLVLKTFAHKHLLPTNLAVIDVMIVSLFIPNLVMAESHNTRMGVIRLTCCKGFIQGENTLRSFARYLRSRGTLISLNQVRDSLTQTLHCRTKYKETLQQQNEQREAEQRKLDILQLGYVLFRFSLVL